MPHTLIPVPLDGQLFELGGGKKKGKEGKCIPVNVKVADAPVADVSVEVPSKSPAAPPLIQLELGEKKTSLLRSSI